MSNHRANKKDFLSRIPLTSYSKIKVLIGLPWMISRGGSKCFTCYLMFCISYMHSSNAKSMGIIDGFIYNIKIVLSFLQGYLEIYKVLQFVLCTQVLINCNILCMKFGFCFLLLIWYFTVLSFGTNTSIYISLAVVGCKRLWQLDLLNVGVPS